MAEDLDNIDARVWFLGAFFFFFFFFFVEKSQSYRRINTVTAMDRTRLIPEEKKKKINRKLREKKLSCGDFCGSVRSQQTYKSLRMALVLLLHPRSPIRFRVNKFLSAEMKRPAEKSGRPKCTEKPTNFLFFSHYYFFIREKNFDISCEASA